MQIANIDVPHLNLARKWRSKNFDEIIGQEIPVRMLKNSLFVGQFFPVYLFSGQRGCGKTSMARIFAAATNCEQLPYFKKDPKNITIPCAICASCKALFVGKHPDCIEIDAASHTGVDHVRQIIDASSFLPLLGNKKIYLIDEAHMLSKAAFNAFLKVLEEPPSSVLFILATTDPEKIIETVKSRCLQVIFKPIKKQTLVDYLENICIKENIAYEIDALIIIAQESEGAARDALNILEQIRFAQEKITKSAIFEVLGHLDDERLLQLFDALLNTSLDKFAQLYATIVTETIAPTFLWQACIKLFQAFLACTYNVPLVHFTHLEEHLKKISKNHSSAIFIKLMRLMYEHEMMFLKTSTPHAFLQMLLFQACQLVQEGEIQSNPGKQNFETNLEKSTNNNSVKKKLEQPVKANGTETKMQNVHLDNVPWSSFLYKVDRLDDPLVASVFKQGRFVDFDVQTRNIKLEFSKDFAMFEDMLLQAKKQWQPLLQEIFKGPANLVISYQESKANGIKKENVPVKEVKQPIVEKVEKPIVTKAVYKKEFVQGPLKKNFTKNNKSFEKVIEVQDKDMWKKTNLVLEFFPGTVLELQREEDVTI